tara:strand:+ start:70 stop:492 length:423 start_codon:yes stop_codon:yes gene_type:complete
MQYKRASRIKVGPKSKAVNMDSRARLFTNPVSAHIAGRVPFWADQKAYTAINIRLAHPKSVVANLQWASRFGEKEANDVAPKALQGPYIFGPKLPKRKMKQTPKIITARRANVTIVRILDKFLSKKARAKPKWSDSCQEM